MLPKVMQPRSGLGELLVKRLLAAIARPVAAIERERGVVEDEPLWVLVTVQADIYRRARPQGAT
jgi:hypothetical protein